MGDFVFDYFMGSIPKSVVVGIFAVNAYVAVKNALFVVGWLGF